MTTEQILSALYARGAHLAVQDGELLLSAADGALDAALIGQVREHKTALIALVARLAGASGAAAAPLWQQRAPSYACPASLAQQRMLFLEELAGNNSYYNMPLAFRIDGPLEHAALERAFTALIAAHDVLRSVYRMSEQGWQQQVRAPGPFALGWHDLALEGAPQQALEALLAHQANYRFDLTTEAPLRAALVRLGPQAHVLSINLHHIAADGLSARTLLAGLGQAYRQHGAGQLVRGWQYADYVEWQQRWLASPQCQTAKAYWLGALHGAPALHGIMPDWARPATQSVQGSHLRVALAAPLVAAAAELARARGTTPFTIYQAVFAALVARYSGQRDIVFGTAAANRQPPEFADAVGLFVNTLVLRFALEPGMAWRALIEQARLVSAAALRHQQLPFDVLVEHLQPARSLAYNPLVQLMLVMQDEDGQALALEGAAVRACEQAQAVSKFDIALHLRSSGGALVLDWEFASGLFAEQTMVRMSAHFCALLAACVADDSVALDACELGAGSVQEHDLSGAAGAPVCVHRLFEQHASRTPQAVALREGERAVSYGQLNELAERLACQLAAAGVGAATAVAVCMEKSVALVVAMLAIYKAGGVYVPLDPHYPAQRLGFMLTDAGAALLLAAKPGEAADAIDTPLARLYMDQLAAGPAAAAYPLCAAPHQGAYIIYTSGSTGQPKGVLVTHANLYYSMHANRAVTGFGPTDLMPSIGSQAFGASLLEITLPLTSGGAVRLLTRAQVADVDELVRASADATVLHAVPSLMRQWLGVLESAPVQQYPKLRLLLCGGESVSDGLLRRVKQWRASVQLLAMYGMTESAIICSSYEATLEHGAPVHYCIGKPYRHARFYVLDEQGREQPAGVPGELHIGGLSIAAGYVGQPGITAERFISWAARGGERIYRTGDRVRCLADGNFEFLGRVDHQVSLRGARIELGEIETIAAAVPGVAQAVAHVTGDEPILVLYYTSALAAHDQPALADLIRAALALRLPDYMRPSLLQVLDTFPLNPNGKVDRKRLPTPHACDSMVLPDGDIERRLLALCQELLQRDDFGVTANFFEIGGHSLMAAKLVSKIRFAFEIAFPLTALYASPTIRSCALLVESALKDKYAASLAGAARTGIAADGDELIL